MKLDMEISQETAAEIAHNVIESHRQNGFEPWALSPTILVQDAIEEWEKIKANRPSDEEGK